MTNTAAILIYSPFLIISVLLLGAVLGNDLKQYVVRQYLFFTLSLIGWQIFEILLFYTESPFWVEYAFNLKLVFVSLIPMFFLFIVIGFYRLNRLVPRWFYGAVFSIPAVTIVLSITSPLHHLLRKNFYIIEMGPPATVVESSWGPWFYAHFFYSECMIILVAFIVIMQTKKLPKSHWDTRIILWIAILASVVSTVVEAKNLDNSPIDMNFVALSLVGVMFYIVAVNNGRADYLNIWRRNILNYLDEMIVVIDESNQLIEANTPAVEYLKVLDIPWDLVSYTTLIQELEGTGKIRIKKADEKSALELFYLDNQFPQVYYAKKKLLPNRMKQGPQSFISISDITRDHLLIERLKETAGVDLLTGMPNRYEYQLMLRAMDIPENLPFSIIIGDVNGLKQVNDELGHLYGDQLLQTVGLAIQACCPENGLAARIGGDEFAMLLPKYGAEKAQEVANCVEECLQSSTDLLFEPSIALGTATKIRQEQNINVLVNEADAQMYSNKTAIKAKAAEPKEKPKHGK